MRFETIVPHVCEDIHRKAANEIIIVKNFTACCQGWTPFCLSQRSIDCICGTLNHQTWAKAQSHHARYYFIARAPADTCRHPSTAAKSPTLCWVLQQLKVDVRFGSKADICSAIGHVRFTPKSGHVRCTSACPLSANSGHRPPHSITSSARSKNASETFSPIALAALTLTTNSNFVGRTTGRSPAFSPLRILAT